MASKLLFASAMAATMADAGYQPKVGQAKDTELAGTARAFAWADSTVGFAVGSYETVISNAYDGDCFSTVFSFALNNIDYS